MFQQDDLVLLKAVKINCGDRSIIATVKLMAHVAAKYHAYRPLNLPYPNIGLWGVCCAV